MARISSSTFAYCITRLAAPWGTALRVTTSRLTKKIVLEPSEALTNLVLDNPGGNSSLLGMADPFSMIILTPTKLSGEIEIEYTTIGSVASPEGEFEIRGLHPGTYTCQITQASSSQGSISRGASREVVVHGETVLKPTENIGRKIELKPALQATPM